MICRYLLFIFSLSFVVACSAQSSDENDAHVTILSPGVNATFALGQKVIIKVDASDPDGIRELNLRVNGRFYEKVKDAPYQFEVSDLALGKHTFAVRSRDFLGNALDANPLEIIVQQTPYTIITSPNPSATFVEGETVSINVDAFDPDGLRELNLRVNGSFYAKDREAPYQFNVSDLEVGTHTLAVRSRDEFGNALDADPVEITVQQAAYISITTPNNSASFVEGETVSINVDAFDPDGLSELNLRVNGSFYAKDREAPYQFNVNDLGVGTHTLAVRSRDEFGNALDADPVEITVQQAPYTLITSPKQSATFVEGETVSINVDAFDPDGLRELNLRVNGSFYAKDREAPYQFNVSDLEVGTHTLAVRSRDEFGNALDADPVEITVQQAAYISITTPNNSASFVEGETVSINVDAFDPDGLSELNLRVNGSFYAKDREAPYQFNVSDLGVGTHTLEVRSRDEFGNALDADPVEITVEEAKSDEPFVLIGSLEDGDVFVEGQTIVVDVDASDEDGVDALRLWVNGRYYDIDKSAPYSFSMKDLSVGNYALFVRSRDSLGNSLDSDVININIEPAPFALFSSPASNQNVDADTPMTVSASAFDPDGLVAVALYLNDSLYATDTSAPYSFELSGLAAGKHTLQLVSTDTNNNQLNSDALLLTAESVSVDPLELPVEVLGAAGTSKSLTFTLRDTTNITHLYLECNACGYHELDYDKNPNLVKASVSVNGGDPVALKQFTENDIVYGNSELQVLGGAAHYGGIGGGFRTVRFLVPVSGLKIGENTLTFKHQDAIPPSIGFRIIDFNLVTNGSVNNMVLSPSLFTHDDPQAWEAPLTTQNASAQGRALWLKRDHLHDPWVDGLDGQYAGLGPMNGKIKASCANCHANEGRDLKYFNFSNLSIVERSKFHGLTEKEGQQIASYIRQLDMPTVDQARPWNPAYQPGPGMDDKPVYEWAAGAGLDAVLDDDADMEAYLFPRGTSLAETRKVVDRYKTLNFRELPVSIPMPEWNQWLPIIHPDDAFDTNNAAVRSDQFGNDVGQPYYKELYDIALNNPTPTKIGRLTIFIKRWLQKGMSCQTNGVGRGEPLRGLNGEVLNAVKIDLNTSDPTNVTRANCNDRRDTQGMLIYEIAKRGLTAWSSVKLWEIAHGLNLEEQSKTMNDPVCAGDTCVDASEARGWNFDGRNVFDRPPHFVGTASGRRFFSQNQMLGILETNAWYHLNMVLNSGYRQAMPSHFAYTYSHVQLLQFESNVDQGYRYWATLIKQRQLQTNGEYGVENGLDLRTAEPYIYYGSARNTTRTETHASVGEGLWANLATALIEDLVADASNASDRDWANAYGNRSVQAKQSTNFSPCRSPCSFDIGPYQGRNTYRVIPYLRDIGVRESALSDLIDWAEATWPRGPWDSVRAAD